MKAATFSIALTPEQATALLQLIDIAVKSSGLQVAHAAVLLHDIIQSAHKAAFTSEN